MIFRLLKTISTENAYLKHTLNWNKSFNDRTISVESSCLTIGKMPSGDAFNRINHFLNVFFSMHFALKHSINTNLCVIKWILIYFVNALKTIDIFTLINDGKWVLIWKTWEIRSRCFWKTEFRLSDTYHGMAQILSCIIRYIQQFSVLREHH